MVLTTGNLVVLGISVVLILIFRRFDRSRMQLAKIKKYADKIIDEYKETSARTMRDFHDALINLDISLKRAKHTGSTMEQHLAEVTAVFERLETERPQLLALEGELQRTCDSLKNTAQLAAALEKQEGSLKRAVGRVDYIAETLGEAEKKLPLLEKNFRQRLEDRTQNFLTEYAEKRLAETEKRLATRMQAADETFARRLQEIEERIHAADADTGLVRQETTRALAEARAGIEQEMDAIYAAMKQQAEAGQNRLLHELEAMESRLSLTDGELKKKTQELARHHQDFSKGVQDDLEQFRTVMEEEKQSLNQEVRAIDTRIKSFIKESKVFTQADSILEELNSGISDLNDRIDRLKNEKESVEELSTSLSRIRDEKDEVRGMLEDLSRDKESLAALTGRLETVENTMNGFENRVIQQRQALDHDLEERRKLLKTEIQSFQSELEEIRKKSAHSAREEITLFNTQFREIDRKVKDFVKQTKLFDKADQLAGKLSGEINDLNNRITGLKNEKKDLLAIRKEVSEIRKEEEEIRGMLERIGKEKAELGGLEHKLVSINSATSELVGRFEKIGKAETVLKPMEARMRDMEKMNQQLKAQMEEINVKDVKLAQALTRFRKADSYVDTLEKKIETVRTAFTAIDEEKKTITREMESLAKQTRRLEDDRTRVTALLGRFDHMEGLMKDVERRVSQITLVQDKIGNLETRMRDLSSQAEVRIEDLSELSRKMDAFFGNKPAPSGEARRTRDAESARNRNTEEKRLNEKIFKMFDSGLDITKIAEIVKRPVADIQLRLHVRKE